MTLEMKVIEIKEKEYSRYKGDPDDFIKSGEYIKVDIPFGRQDIKEELKKYVPLIPTQKVEGRFAWLVPVLPWTLKILMGIDTVYGVPDKFYNQENVLKLREKLKGIELRSYQREIINQVMDMICNQKKAVKMGLVAPLGSGKTLIVLLLSMLGKTIYVCPKSVKKTIQNECKKWGFEEPDITTPESAWKLFERAEEEKEPYKVGVVDEVLSVKNPKAKKTKGVKEGLEGIPLVIGMTGTAQSARRGSDFLGWMNTITEGTPDIDKYQIFNFGINPHYRDLEKELGVDTGGKNPLVCDSWNTEKMVKITSKICKVIDAKEVMEGLPELVFEKVYLPTPRNFRLVVSGALTEQGVHKMVSQARTASSGFVYDDGERGEAKWFKETEKLDWIEEFIEENPEEPIVIVDAWEASQRKLEERLKEYKPVVIAGYRKDDINNFAGCQAGGKFNVLILSANITEGLNLQLCRLLIFSSLSTSPVKRIQGVGRIHRQGQKRGCRVYDLICEGTLDERALELITEYNQESDKFVEAKLAEELKRIKEER